MEEEEEEEEGCPVVVSLNGAVEGCSLDCIAFFNVG